jgi:heme-degrading monooxygenase HmoA
MIVVNRFRTDSADDTVFREDLERALAVLGVRPGFEDGRLGRNVDEPTLWVMVTRWKDVGSYRRALSSYEVKMDAVQTLSRAIEEPSAFEPLDGDLNTAVPRDLDAR